MTGPGQLEHDRRRKVLPIRLSPLALSELTALAARLRCSRSVAAERAILFPARLRVGVVAALARSFSPDPYAELLDLIDELEKP